ncbi:MAG: hypothetical protein K2K08_02520 [Paramuribaculum sp.]|nr:hypothetical protein [Paramuribaculum sp.]MDE6651261.1 hypothetical protein [Paramuribaculum sp.]
MAQQKTPDKEQQSVYPPDTPRKNWAAIIITLVIIAAGIIAFYCMGA